MTSPHAESHWIEFVIMGRTDKTFLWDIALKESGVVLGRVKWFGRWRRCSKHGT